MDLIEGLRKKGTVTENAMPTHTSSGDACLDFFMTAGATRNWTEKQILTVFSKAIVKNPLMTMKILFWARDIRGGAGERRLFRVCIKYVAERYPKYLNKVLHLIPEYGRWDDLFEIEDSRIFEIIKNGLLEKDGLLAKWLPRKGPFANEVRKYLGITPKTYRKLIVGLSNTVEQKMCGKKWEGIEYAHIPSQAMNKYRKAFFRNDGDRFLNFIENVKVGKEKINAGAIYPYQLFDAFLRKENQDSVEAQWEALPNYMEDCEYKILPVCDTSGSMYWGIGGATPISVAVSLGIYISERNEGIFKNAFLTFSQAPQLQQLNGSFYNRCTQLSEAHWGMNTNIEAIFNIILKTATRENLSEKKMPDVILIISDMQFDRCVHDYDNTMMEMVRDRYKKAGYKLPSIVFWNVNAAIDQSPVNHDEAGTAIISGFSPSILKSVLSGIISDPMEILKRTVLTERYDPIEI